MIEHHDQPDVPSRMHRRRFGRRRPIDLPLLLASLAIAVGLVVIVWGVTVSVTGDDEDLPDGILAVGPGDGATQVPSRPNITVDLELGYTGRLFIDGVEIPVVDADEARRDYDLGPGEQVTMPPVAIYEPGSATISFTPSDDAPIIELERGNRELSVIYWEAAEGEEAARTYNWEFEVL